MEKERDQIWDEITDSAKAKIDYAEFEAFFDGLGGDMLPDNVLFAIIVGYAGGNSDDELAQQLKGEFLKIGCLASDEEICWLLRGRPDTLKNEIMATDLAVNLLEQGWGEQDVLLQVQRFLAERTS